MLQSSGEQTTIKVNTNNAELDTYWSFTTSKVQLNYFLATFVWGHGNMKIT